jgi:hypothetical protein
LGSGNIFFVLPAFTGGAASRPLLRSIFNPGTTASLNVLSGPEAFYAVSGDTCLETPDGVQTGRGPGNRLVLRAGPSMLLMAIGKAPRQGFALILHDASLPPTTLTQLWHPSGLCARQLATDQAHQPKGSHRPDPAIRQPRGGLSFRLLESASGYSGLEDRVDFHTWQLLKGVAISTLLGVGAQLQFTGGSDLVEAVRESTQQNISRAGDQLTSKTLNIQPSITVRPGAPVRLIVHRDLVIPPIQGA